MFDQTVHKARNIKILETTIKIIIVLLGCWILYKKLIFNQDLSQLWEVIKSSFTTKRQVILIVIAFLMMPLNITLESLKWKVVIKPIENVTFKSAFQAIFTGITAGMFFPNRMGDFLGRIFILEKGNRLKAAMATMIGNIAQMIATISLGCIGAIFFIMGEHILIGVVIAVIIIVFLILCFFNIKILKHLQVIIPQRFKEKTEKYTEVFAFYGKKSLAKILVLAFTRYLLYSLQFVILIWAFNVPLTYFNAMIPISFTYLMMMIIPFITIMEIAVRGSVSIMVFDKWLIINGINTSLSMMVFSASTLLWFFNLAVPAIIGIFGVRKLKFIRKNYES